MNNDHNLIAYCGLNCEACSRYLSKKCLGCQENEKATWCAVRSCCKLNNFLSCANCNEYQNPKKCKKFHNFISKIFGLIFNSDRSACIEKIKEIGLERYAEYMKNNNLQTIKRR